MAGIVQSPTPIPMTNGDYPNLKFAIFKDSLATVTSAGYLTTAIVECPMPLSNADVLLALYNYNTNTKTGNFGIFSVNIAAVNGAVTLTSWVNSGNVTAPVVTGDVPVFSGTTGLIIDSGVTLASITGGITQLGQLYQTSVTLTPAQVIASYATPIVLIPAVAGKVAIVHSANVYTASTGNTAFATGVAPIIQYGTTVHGAGTIAVGTGLVTDDITAATSQVRTINAAASAVYTGNTSTAVTFSCTTAYTGGTGTNVTFTLVYELITATV